MDSLDDALNQILTSRKKAGNLRALPQTDPSLIDFSSNDYLGLARSVELQAYIQKTILQQHLQNGSTGSRLLTGNSDFAEQLENKLAEFFKGDGCLLFNSGYAANTGVLSSLPGKNDTILYDEFSHASIKDGIRLSLATRHPFRHNDLNDLEQKIMRSKGRVFVVVESVYSMDGDEAPLVSLIGLKQKYDFEIIVDEAHSTGVFGEFGEGISVSKQLHNAITARIYTFGKALGSHGACVITSSSIKNYLINFSRPFIYSTALPPHTLASISGGFDFIRMHRNLIKDLRNKTELFIQRLSPDIRSQSSSAIQTVITPGNEQCKDISKKLRTLQFDIRPILSPTVPTGEERLRICLHTYNSHEEIINLANAINELKKQ